MAAPEVNFVVAGPNKSASTWIYQALSEHPDICMSQRDPTMFFDVYYDKGRDWYDSNFDHYDGESAVGDESPGYIKSVHAPKRIASDLSDPKVVFCLRNPMERAYSQWWHGYSRNWHNTNFATGINNHEFFDYWINPGFYYMHLERWKQYLSPESMYVTLFDDFVEDNEQFIQGMYDFLDVDSSHTPSVVGEKVNEAKNAPLGPVRTATTVVHRTNRAIQGRVPRPLVDAVLSPLYHKGLARVGGAVKRRLERGRGSKRSYENGIASDVRHRLEKVYVDDAQKLQEKIDRNLDHWFEFEAL